MGIDRQKISAENSITGLSRPAGRENFLTYLPNWKLTCPTLEVKNWKFTSPTEDLYAHLLFRYISLAQILSTDFSCYIALNLLGGWSNP